MNKLTINYDIPLYGEDIVEVLDSYGSYLTTERFLAECLAYQREHDIPCVSMISNYRYANHSGTWAIVVPD